MDRNDKENRLEIYREAYEALRLHFVYNAMNAVKYYIGREPETAERMIDDLAVFLRGSVSRALNSCMVSLYDELRLVRAYAELESLKNRRLKLVWNIEPEEALVPGGSIYQTAQRMIKSNTFGVRQTRTMCVENASGQEAVCIRILETEDRELIPYHREEVPTGSLQENTALAGRLKGETQIC